MTTPATDDPCDADSRTLHAAAQRPRGSGGRRRGGGAWPRHPPRDRERGDLKTGREQKRRAGQIAVALRADEARERQREEARSHEVRDAAQAAVQALQAALLRRSHVARHQALRRRPRESPEREQHDTDASAAWRLAVTVTRWRRRDGGTGGRRSTPGARARWAGAPTRRSPSRIPRRPPDRTAPGTARAGTCPRGSVARAETRAAGASARPAAGRSGRRRGPAGTPCGVRRGWRAGATSRRARPRTDRRR